MKFDFRYESFKGKFSFILRLLAYNLMIGCSNYIYKKKRENSGEGMQSDDTKKMSA